MSGAGAAEELARGTAAAQAGAAEHEPAGAGGDVLSDVLRAVRLTGSLFFLVEEAAPYAAAAPSGEDLAPVIVPGAQRVISYHVVREGRCWFSVPPGGSGSWLEAGDALVIPHGDAHELSSPREERSSLPLEERLAFFRRLATRELPPVVAGTGSGPPVRLVCGFLGCDVLPYNPVLASLPRALVVRRAAAAGDDRLRQLAALVVAEASAPSAGSDCVLLRLGELVFVEVLRRHLAALPAEETGWLAALRDPAIGRALAVLHARPHEPWTLERLAREAALSRSVFAERFAHFVGQPPIQYLTRWRIQRAARLLADGRETVAAVAHAVGYASEAAFSRAFKKAVGVSPAAWRRRTAGAHRNREPARDAAGLGL